MTTEQHVITSSKYGEYTRDIWLLPGPTDGAHRLCVFLEAEYYIRDMNCVPVIEELLESGTIPRSPASSCRMLAVTRGTMTIHATLGTADS
jgi:hypothetical protein